MSAGSAGGGAGGGGGEGADEDAEVHDAEVASVVRGAEELLGEGGGDGGHRAVAGADEHHHHHDHDADEVFTSWGKETAHKYSREDLDKALHALDEGAYGMILRAKGIVDGGDTWYEFDMVPGEHEIRPCGPDVTGKLCVIGSQLKEHEIAELFHV